MNIYDAKVIDRVRNFAALSCIMIVRLMLCMQLILALGFLYEGKEEEERRSSHPFQ